MTDKASASYSRLRKVVDRLSNFRCVIGYSILVLSYALLIPGIIFDLYVYTQTFQGKVVSVTHKTLITTITMLYDDGSLFASILVAFFGIVVPTLKLIMIVLGRLCKLTWMTRAVTIISKWAIVDAIVASVLMAYLSFALGGAITAHVEQGFSFFVSYCILSTVAALILDDCDDWLKKSETRWFRGFSQLDGFLSSRKVGGVSLVVACGLTIAGLLLPSVEVGIANENVPLSIASCLQRLSSPNSGDGGPLALMVIFVVFMPMLEMFFNGVMLAVPKDNVCIRHMLRILPHAGLVDVYVVSMVVMYIFLNSLNSLGMHVQIPASGFSLLIAGVLVMVLSRFVTNRFLIQQFLSNELSRRESPQCNGDVEKGINSSIGGSLDASPTKSGDNSSVAAAIP